MPPVERGETLYMIFQFETLVSGAQMKATFNSGKMEISSTTTAVSSVTDAVRLGDAFRQVIKSISGGAIDAPLFNANADLYNQFIFQGNQLRQVKDKPFNMTLEKLLKYLPEINGDYEVTPDGNVFIGVLKKIFILMNFVEVLLLAQMPTFRETFNDKYKVNKLEFKYSKYEDGNNEEEADSFVICTHRSAIPYTKQAGRKYKKYTSGFCSMCLTCLKKQEKEMYLLRTTQQSQRMTPLLSLIV